MKKKRAQEILPWNNGELETLLKGLIAHGTELAKVDFKIEIETNTNEQKADLLKDIIAIANTYDGNHEDHGFIIYGVKAKAIIGISHTETDTDKFQNHIEQLLKTYISPMPQIYVIGFEADTAQKWGVIVIPPRNNKPHMFFKDLFCTDRTRTRRKGEWFVRRGSTTDPGLPEDLAIITQRQAELNLEPLRESIRGLQSRVAKVEEQYNSALFKLVERALAALPENTDKKPENKKEEIGSDIGIALGIDLPTRIKQKLKTPTDQIAEDLIAEAKTIREMIDSPASNVPWAPQLNNAPGNKKIIEELEEKTRAFQMSIATILLNDHKGIYTDALLRALKILAKMVDAPSGTSYNRIGIALRYYPLGLVIYTIFICGVAANRSELLRKVLDIPLRGRERSVSTHITEIFFFWYEAKILFNDAFTQKWCEPIGNRIRQIITDRIGELIPDFTEPEYFFGGEFVLALDGVDTSMKDGEDIEHQCPLPGLYLYFDEASDVVRAFLLEHPDWFERFYNRPINEILDAFDRNANKMVSSACFGMGLRGLKASETYQESLQRKAKK